MNHMNPDRIKIIAQLSTLLNPLLSAQLKWKKNHWQGNDRAANVQIWNYKTQPIIECTLLTVLFTWLGIQLAIPWSHIYNDEGWSYHSNCHVRVKQIKADRIFYKARIFPWIDILFIHHTKSKIQPLLLFQERNIFFNQIHSLLIFEVTQMETMLLP